MSRAAARVEPTEGSSASDLFGRGGARALLEAAYHHSIGGFLTMSTCHRSKAALSESCHFALFVNPVARTSTDQFFT